ncbi:3-beta hydroxysteroid dehydrogenase/isomerase family-domain-containing protein [Mycena galericulata]|nr:3-beta hydroxysteroid dehydrogenase/isomerase family-domain-containing protein [Mycena galericulata]
MLTLNPKLLRNNKFFAQMGGNGLMTVALRPGGIFGPGDRETITGAYTAFKLGLTCVQLGDNTNLFDRTYVTNVAHAHVLAIQKLDDPVAACDVAGHAFFINDGEPVPFWDHMRDIWAIFFHAFPSRSKPKYVIVIPKTIALILANVVVFLSWILGKNETAFTPHTVVFATTAMCFSNAKAKRVLGYEPRINIQEGFKRTAQWFESNQLDKKR